MKDQVADVLVARRALDRTTPAGVVASVVLHALIVTAFLVATRGTPREFRPITTVTIVPANAPRMKAPSSGGGKTSENRKSTPPPKPVPKQNTAAPVATADTSKNAKRVVDKALFGKSTEKSKPAATATAAAEARPEHRNLNDTGEGAPSDTGTGSVPAVGQSGVTGLDAEFPYPLYIERMVGLIGRKWFRPQAPGEPLTVIYFSIQRDGTIRDVKVESSSGSTLFDRAAQRAVLESSPLPPLPFAFRGTELGVHLTFH